MLALASWAVEMCIRDRLEALINRTIKKVGEDIDALKANTAIAQLMILDVYKRQTSE